MNRENAHDSDLLVNLFIELYTLKYIGSVFFLNVIEIWKKYASIKAAFHAFNYYKTKTNKHLIT